MGLLPRPHNGLNGRMALLKRYAFSGFQYIKGYWFHDLRFTLRQGKISL